LAAPPQFGCADLAPRNQQPPVIRPLPERAECRDWRGADGQSGDQATAGNGGPARVPPGRYPALTVTEPPGQPGRLWDDSCAEGRPYPCAMCAFCAPACGICAGRTPGAAKQPTFNPWVQGSSPWRPTI